MCLSEQLEMLFLSDKYRGADVTNSIEDPFREIVGLSLIKELSSKIGRASCRERV